MKKVIFLLLVLPNLTFSQTTLQKVFTQDIDNFWIAYDSIRSTKDNTKQIDYINRLYIAKASDGLKAFLRNKNEIDKKYADLINNDEKFWNTIRPRTLTVRTKVKELEERIYYFSQLYPNLKEAGTYFIIGIRQQGGTIRNNLSIIGTEVVMSSPETNSSELIRLAIHEYVHTQQTKPDFRTINVLASSIREGACDFISELVTKKTCSTKYIEYGLKHEVEVWRVFKQDMFTQANDLWVSTGDNPVLPARDLGYFIGYSICKSYYNKAKDKKQAIKDIIELDYSTQDAVINFLRKSHYEEYIVSKGYKPSERLRTEGYKSDLNTVTFLFNILDRNVISDNEGNYQLYNEQKFGKINTISVAGGFNNWDVRNSSFQLTKDKNGQFRLTIDKKKLGSTGDKVKFKFILNNAYWIEPGFDIINRTTDNDGNTNLYIQL